MKDGRELDLSAYWAAALTQRAGEMAAFFAPGAQVLWPNTNERFTAEEFIRANCEYPGAWEGEVERVEDGRIAALEEYWGDDGPPPAWRQALGIGRPIR